jgi:hypothetical protein
VEATQCHARIHGLQNAAKLVQTHDVVSQQKALIRIPHMAADLTATYSNFALKEAG